MRPIAGLILRNWPALALAISIVVLAGAYAFQVFGGLQPCELCHLQREVYFIAIPVAALALVSSRLDQLKTFAPWLGAVLAIIFLGGALIAGYHAGVEWHWWPGPQACTGGAGPVSAAALGRLMRGGRFNIPRCDEAAWRLLGISMAGWNTLISAGLAAWTAAWVARERKA
ncbi:MAG TPA: disulfide bond formation protein B [Caulobacteraceae bacterium]|nr:disulfide bond formation protein B [Caulobacteraceae bacterium]